jgi:hypothetical protein
VPCALIGKARIAEWRRGKPLLNHEIGKAADMPNGRKRKRKKIATHKRKKRLRKMRHKNKK